MRFDQLIYVTILISLTAGCGDKKSDNKPRCDDQTECADKAPPIEKDTEDATTPVTLPSTLPEIGEKQVVFSKLIDGYTHLGFDKDGGAYFSSDLGNRGNSINLKPDGTAGFTIGALMPYSLLVSMDQNAAGEILLARNVNYFDTMPDTNRAYWSIVNSADGTVIHELSHQADDAEWSIAKAVFADNDHILELGGGIPMQLRKRNTQTSAIVWTKELPGTRETGSFHSQANGMFMDGDKLVIYGRTITGTGQINLGHCWQIVPMAR